MYKREQDITPKSKLLWSSSNSHCIITADKGGHGENECVVGRDQAGAAVGLVVGAEVVGEVNGDTVGPGVVGESVGLVVGSALVGEIDGELVGFVVVGPVPGASVREGEAVGAECSICVAAADQLTVLAILQSEDVNVVARR